MDWPRVWIDTAAVIIRDNNLDTSPEKLALEWRKYQREAIQSSDLFRIRNALKPALKSLCETYNIKNRNYHLLLYEK